MNIKRAKLIAALIADLDKDCEYTDYVAEVKQFPYDKNEYSVILSSRTNRRNQLCDLVCFARTLEELGTKVHVIFNTYSIELA